MSSAGEGSTSRALEEYITAQFSSLALEVPNDDIEFIARFVEEEGMEREDKIEGVKGMLEGVVEGVSAARTSSRRGRTKTAYRVFY